MNNKKDSRDLNEFQIRNIRILSHLLVHNAIDDDIVELLRRSELDYFSIVDKLSLMEQKINIDEKTNLLKYKKDYLTNIIKTASRIYYGGKVTSYHITLIRLDIDDFSLFNNKYSHEAGDRVLKRIADIIKENSRPTDYAIRFGGEEMDVLLPSTDMDGAKIFLNNLYEKIRKTCVMYDGKELQVTVSAGASIYEYIFNNGKKIVDQEIEDIFIKMQCRADDALYDAKDQGKNRFCFYKKEKGPEYTAIRESYTKKRNPQ